MPPAQKAAARRMVAAALADPPAACAPAPRAWVRVNAARTDLCAADLDAVAADAFGIRIPKAESPEDVAWVAERAPGKPIICAIESARGLLAAGLGPGGGGRVRRRRRRSAPAPGRRVRRPARRAAGGAAARAGVIRACPRAARRPAR